MSSPSFWEDTRKAGPVQERAEMARTVTTFGPGPARGDACLGDGHRGRHESVTAEIQESPKQLGATWKPSS